MFTTQGGIERHAEAVLSQLAEAVAKEESDDLAVVKAELLERISLCIARSVARSALKRSPETGRPSYTARIVNEMAQASWQ